MKYRDFSLFSSNLFPKLLIGEMQTEVTCPEAWEMQSAGAALWVLEQSAETRYGISDPTSKWVARCTSQELTFLPWRGDSSVNGRAQCFSLFRYSYFLPLNSSPYMNKSPAPIPDPPVLPAINLCLHLDQWYSHFIIFFQGGWSRLWPALNSVHCSKDWTLGLHPDFWPLPNPTDLSALPNSSFLSQNQWNHK